MYPPFVMKKIIISRLPENATKKSTCQPAKDVAIKISPKNTSGSHHFKEGESQTWCIFDS
jgi:hypothetical protein